MPLSLEYVESAKPKFCVLEIKEKSSKIREKNSLQVCKHKGVGKGYYYCAKSPISWKITWDSFLPKTNWNFLPLFLKL